LTTWSFPLACSRPADGKDDYGEYLANTAGVSVRISLGLKAQFERTLFWSPKKRAGEPKGLVRQPSLIAAAPEGVYVYENTGFDWITLFDHEGNYLRTVLPFPAGDVMKIASLKWHTFPDGTRVPLKWGLPQRALLTSGSTGFGGKWPSAGGIHSASAMCLHDGELYLVKGRRGPRHGRQRLYVNPANGWVYVGEHHDPAVIHVKSIKELLGIDPETGRIRRIPLPFDAEDLAFDGRGLAYLRTVREIARYDARDWREVPFDYGEEREGLGYHPIKKTDAISVANAVGHLNASSQMGGMGVSQQGHVAMVLCNPTKPPARKDEQRVGSEDVKTYTPRMFPGRKRGYEVHIWDQRGKLVYEDALPGISNADGINLDKDDNVYVLSDACRIKDGKRYFNDATCTLIKARPQKTRILSPKAQVPLTAASRPKRPPDLLKGSLGRAWVVDAEWMQGGVGMDGKQLGSASRNCHCEANSRPALDYFARSFLPEIERSTVVVLDTNGNLILRIGRYGNVDDGVPLVLEGGPKTPRSIGGDEVALFWGHCVATHTDRRLFIADPGNARVLSVKLGYYAEQNVSLTDTQN